MKKTLSIIITAALCACALGGCASVNATGITPAIIDSAADAVSAAPWGGALLAEYETKFSENAKARNANIRLAASAIDGTVVNPGETFSYNEALGPTTKEKGYKRAQIFIKGRKSYGYGGGICQVSSTLYNAVELAGLDVVERHSHSLPVDYVPKDKDAATSYGSVDFRFTNSLTRPVRIDSFTTDGAVNVKIFEI